MKKANILLFIVTLVLFLNCNNSSINNKNITVIPIDAANKEKVTVKPAKAAEGETVTLTAALGSQRQVYFSAQGVTVNPATITANNGTATFIMPSSDVIITATFSDIPSTAYSVAVTAVSSAVGEAVTVKPAKAAEGETVTLTAALGSQRQVYFSAQGVTINPATITDNNGTATFIMPSYDVIITATFSDIPSTAYSVAVTAVSSAVGEAVIVNSATAAEGETVTLTAALGSQRKVSLTAPGVTVNPATITANNGTATFIMPSSDVIITATFSDIPKPVEVVFRGTGETCPGGTNQNYIINLGEEADDRIVVVCIAGWRNTSRSVNSVTVNGVSLTKRNQDTGADQPSSIWSGVVPTGTNVQINTLWNGDNSAVGIAVYSIYNATSDVPTVSLAGSTTSYTINGEIGTGIVSFFSASEPYNNFTWSGSVGVVKDVEMDYSACYGVNRLVLSTASCVMQSASSNVIANGSTNNRYLYVLGFK